MLFQVCSINCFLELDFFFIETFRFQCASLIIVYSQQNHSQIYEILFQKYDLNCLAGSDGDYEEPADHLDGGLRGQIGASVSLLLALSMLDG